MGILCRQLRLPVDSCAPGVKEDVHHCWNHLDTTSQTGKEKEADVLKNKVDSIQET
jgi:hypothetical protein